MQTHNLKRAHPNKKRRMVGRGGKHAKTSGRGTKGQNARAGHKKRPEIRDFIKRIPKLRGRGVNSNLTIQTKPVTLNIGLLEKTFKAGDKINPTTLLAAKLISKTSGSLPKVKILGTGSLSKKLTVSGCELSSSARLAIEKVGGNIEG